MTKPEEKIENTPKKRTLLDIIKERQKKPEKEQLTEHEQKEKSIKYSIKDGIFTSMKSGFSESFVMPFAIAMNATTNTLVLLASLPQLIAAYLQLFSEKSLTLFKTRGKLIFWTAFIQAFIWLPILLIPFIAKGNMLLLITLITIESVIGTFQGPVFNSILGDIISEDKRGEVLGKRNSIINLTSFITTFIAGLILTTFKNLDHNGTTHYIFFGFAILFTFSFITRLTASFYKAKMYDPPYKPRKNKTTFMTFLKNMTKDNYGIFVIYVFMFKFAAAISSPFFELYLLRDLGMSYIYFALITAVSIASSFLALKYFGKKIDQHGSKKILTIAGFIVPLSPLLLVAAVFIQDPIHRLAYLLIEEAFSGIAWSAFNLSTSSFLFDATKKEERIRYTAYYNFIIGIAIFAGAITGGALIKAYPELITSGIPLIYLTSGTLRLIATTIMIKKVREAKLVEVTILGGSFASRTLSIRPRFGNTVEIISNNHHHKEEEIKEETKIKKKPKVEEYQKEALEEYREKMAEKNEKEKYSKIKTSNTKEYTKKISEITQEIKRKETNGNNNGIHDNKQE